MSQLKLKKKKKKKKKTETVHTYSHQSLSAIVGRLTAPTEVFLQLQHPIEPLLHI